MDMGIIILSCSQIATFISGVVTVINFTKKNEAKEKQITELNRIVSELETSNIERKKQSDSLQGQLDVMIQELGLKKQEIENTRKEKLKDIQPYFKTGESIGFNQNGFFTSFKNEGKERATILDFVVNKENSNVEVRNDIQEINSNVLGSIKKVGETFSITLNYTTELERKNILLLFKIIFEDMYSNKYEQEIYCSNGNIRERQPVLINE